MNEVTATNAPVELDPEIRQFVLDFAKTAHRGNDKWLSYEAVKMHLWLMCETHESFDLAIQLYLESVKV